MAVMWAYIKISTVKGAFSMGLFAVNIINNPLIQSCGVWFPLC